MRTAPRTRSCGSRQWPSWAASTCRSRPSGNRSVAGSTSSCIRNVTQQEYEGSLRSRSSRRRAALGASVDEAVGAYAGVVAGEDLAPFAIVLGAFARSGGKIGRSLGRVATLLRGRIALEDERKALTAQGRVSAIVLVALAPLGGMFFAVMTPEYVAVMFDRGRWLLVVAIALEIVGRLWLWKILRLSTPGADLATLLDAVIVGLEAGLTFELALSALVTRAPMVARLPQARRLPSSLCWPSHLIGVKTGDN